MQTSDEDFSDTRIMAKKKHNKDKKLHNSNEPDLTWQEAADLSPEDEVEGGSEIYYFADEDGNIHSSEFLSQELLPDDSEVESSLKRKSSGKLQKLKPGAVDITSLQAPDEASQQVTLPAPKSGAPPFDIRISSEVVPDLSARKRPQGAADKQVIINLHSQVADGHVIGSHDHESGAPLTLYFTRAELDAYVAYRSEGMAKKSKDWISTSSETLWESTKGEISHQTVTGLRTFVLDKYQSRDSHSKARPCSVDLLLMFSYLIFACFIGS